MIGKYQMLGSMSLVCMVLVGCNDIPSEYREFFRLSPSEMEKTLIKFPQDQQIDLMIIGWTKPHPPIGFFFLVSKNGESIVPLLIQRMAETDDLETLRPLALCLYDVDKWHFPWTAHKNYVESLERVLGQKRDLIIKREVIGILKTGMPHSFF